MKANILTLRILSLCLALLALHGCNQSSEDVTVLPSFGSYPDVIAKKQAFFDFMSPIIEAENNKVTVDRERMLAISSRLDDGKKPAKKDIVWLQALAEEYGVEMPSLEDKQAWALLKRRVDTVPLRLALAQSANESSWGTSRFAVEGFNMFGMWCFSAGCGIVPSARTQGMDHEVAIYPSVNASVAAYLHSINRVETYTPLRKQRYKLHQQGKKPTAVELAEELGGYSEHGEECEKELQSMIRVNYDLMSTNPPKL